MNAAELKALDEMWQEHYRWSATAYPQCPCGEFVGKPGELCHDCRQETNRGVSHTPSDVSYDFERASQESAREWDAERRELDRTTDFPERT